MLGLRFASRSGCIWAGFVTGGSSDGSVEAEEMNWALEELFRCPKMKVARRSPDFS
jgi:hypothetical protein